MYRDSFSLSISGDEVIEKIRHGGFVAKLSKEKSHFSKNVYEVSWCDKEQPFCDIVWDSNCVVIDIHYRHEFALFGLKDLYEISAYIRNYYTLKEARESENKKVGMSNPPM